MAYGDFKDLPRSKSLPTNKSATHKVTEISSENQ